ncbi:uncharacterized protein PG986_006851 [Apiospora aurea]|uniref:Uncharacterized protein n=1 Tax=Apiospora aurea TaxID=335848 RepID=A0ABR1QB93_9PEZI
MDRSLDEIVADSQHKKRGPRPRRGGNGGGGRDRDNGRLRERDSYPRDGVRKASTPCVFMQRTAQPTNYGRLTGHSSSAPTGGLNSYLSSLFELSLEKENPSISIRSVGKQQASQLEQDQDMHA